MIEKKYLILRYGEINLKGKNRKFFEKALKKNIKQKTVGFEVKISYLRNRIIVETIPEQTNSLSERFLKLPGIENLSIGIKTQTDYEDIKNLVLTQFDKKKPKFRVSTKRSYKGFPYTSQDMSQKIGGEILKANDGLPNLEVSLKNFDQEIKIEILEKETFIINETFSAMGGLPIGTSGKGLILLSGGIDSPVAAIEVMKRGVKIDCAHFYTPPYTTEKALEKVFNLVKVLKEYDSTIELFNFNITNMQLEIQEKCKDSYGLILMRRMMYRKASELCITNKYDMILTGESIGQVASQTIENITLTNIVAEVPVIRPLITFNKNEIINKAKLYGTYDISIQPFDDACSIFAPKNPQTKGKVEVVLEEEEKIDFKLFLSKIKEEKYEDKKKENLLEDLL